MKQFDFSSLSKFLVSQGEAKEEGKEEWNLRKIKFPIPLSPAPFLAKRKKIKLAEKVSCFSVEVTPVVLECSPCLQPLELEQSFFPY